MFAAFGKHKLFYLNTRVNYKRYRIAYGRETNTALKSDKVCNICYYMI